MNTLHVALFDENQILQESEIAAHKKHDVNLSFSVFAQLLAHGQKNLNKF